MSAFLGGQVLGPQEGSCSCSPERERGGAHGQRNFVKMLRLWRLVGVKGRCEASSFTGESLEGRHGAPPAPSHRSRLPLCLPPPAWWHSLWERLGITSMGHLSFLGNPSSLQMPVSGGSTQAQGHHLLPGSSLGIRDGRELWTCGRRGAGRRILPRLGHPSAEGDLRIRAAELKPSG